MKMVIFDGYAVLVFGPIPFYYRNTILPKLPFITAFNVTIKTAVINLSPQSNVSIILA